MPSPSTVPQMPIVLCGCCRSPSKRKQEKLNDLSSTRISTVFESTQHSLNSTRAERLPVIVVSCPSTPSLEPHESDEQESSVDAEDLYFTARTSHEIDYSLKNMADLVREIRIEAGLPVTPRENELCEKSTNGERANKEPSSSKSADEHRKAGYVPSYSCSIESCGRQGNEELHAQAVQRELNTVVAHFDDRAAAYGRNLRAALSAAPQSIAYVINIIYVWCTTAILHIIDALF